MKEFVRIICISLVSSACASPRAATPAPCVTRTPTPHTRYKIDLGFLDEPRVQEHVAAREAARQRILEIYRLVGRLIERVNAMNFAVAQLPSVSPAVRLQSCIAEHPDTSRDIALVSPTLRLVTEKIEALNARVEHGGYALQDTSLHASFEQMLLSYDMATRAIADAESSLKTFCRCAGATFSLRNNAGQLIFSTGTDSHI